MSRAHEHARARTVDGGRGCVYYRVNIYYYYYY